MQEPQRNDNKFKELLLFISERSESDPGFGATKLNKLLFYADFLFYLETGEAITWHPYQRLEWGPAPRYLLPIQKEMEVAKEIAFRQQMYGSKMQSRCIALRSANLELFSATEIAFVTRLIENYWGRNGSQMSELSHRFIGWQAAVNGEYIPYELALMSAPEPTTHVRQRGMELEKLATEALSRSNG